MVNKVQQRSYNIIKTGLEVGNLKDGNLRADSPDIEQISQSELDPSGVAGLVNITRGNKQEIGHDQSGARQGLL